MKQPAFTLEPIKNVFLQASTSRKEFLDGDDYKKREIVKSLLWNLSIKDKNIVETKYKSPYHVVAKMPKNGSIYEMLRIVNDVRTIFEGQNEYIYIPDLRKYSNA